MDGSQTGRPLANEAVINTVFLTYFMAQQPLKNFDPPLMRVSLSNSILVTLFSTRGRVIVNNNNNNNNFKI